MCLLVDWGKEIYDDKDYIFYKIVYSRKGYYESIYKLTQYPKSGWIYAECMWGTAATERLPACGKKAWQEYGTGGNIRDVSGECHEGIHAYEDLKDAKEAGIGFVSVIWRYEIKIIKVKVKGRHIMAFGLDGDVCFTRGEIIGEVKG